MLQRDAAVSPFPPLQIVRHLCLGDMTFVHLFSAQIPRAELTALLRSLMCSRPPDFTSSVYYFYSLAAFLGETPALDLTHFYLMDLKLINKRWSNSLFTSLSHPTHQFAFRTFVSNCIRLFSGNQPLFRALETVLLEMLQKVPFKDLMAEIRFDFYEVVMKSNVQFVQLFDYQKLLTTSNFPRF
jgi:hypothetical protein